MREAARNKVRATLAPARRPGLLRSLQFKTDGSVTTVNETGEEDCYCYGHGFLAPLYDQRGEWTLTVTELVGFDLAPPYEQTRLAGPWVFHFRVP